MYRSILFVCSICVIYAKGSMADCSLCKKDKTVCGVDDVSYNSFCELACRKIGFQCDGPCPCDATEVVNMDQKTVKKLAKYRQGIQLEGHERDLESDDIVAMELSEGPNKGEEDKGFKIVACPKREMEQLPRRLIDWFHVLKTNEKEEMFRLQGIEKEPVLKELKFVDAKLRALYSKLACKDNDDDVESEVCLSSVKWMFNHLDYNKDKALSQSELIEIEEIDHENCIQPFLQDCDSNNDGKVIMNEFCKCLCLTPPCAEALSPIPTVLLNGKPGPFPGLFIPRCDEDGFFMPLQHNVKKQNYWCVDRNGAEIKGTRQKTKPDCAINTRKNTKSSTVYPMDMARENSPE